MSDFGWKSRVIPKDDLTAYQRWELPLVDDEERAAHEAGLAEEEQNHLPTAEEIEAIQRQAFDEAYQEGLAKGIEDGRVTGHKEGYDAGWEQGLAEGRNDIQSRASRLELLMAALGTPLDELDYRVEQELVTLATAVARHLVRRELKTDPGQIVATVREAITALPASSRKIRVYLHPDDAQLVRDALSLNDEVDEDARWRVVDDPVVTRGGCRVETEHSRIDATVESRLAEAIARMLGGERESDDETPPAAQPAVEVPVESASAAPPPAATMMPQAETPPTEMPQAETPHQAVADQTSAPLDAPAAEQAGGARTADTAATASPETDKPEAAQAGSAVDPAPPPVEETMTESQPQPHPQPQAEVHVGTSAHSAESPSEPTAGPDTQRDGPQPAAESGPDT